MKKQITKPSILPGFMELLPADQLLFNRMLDTIRRNYEKYGFAPLDTPVIEKSEILLAKGGGETEKQIYRFTKGDTDLSLRFDLTVPLARYVAQHFSDLNFPFRRYHIGKVYRGERNQRGRFREFYQCDIDIIGNGKLSLIYDAEIPSIIYSTFTDLGFGPFLIRINNRKLLNGFFESMGIENKTDILRTIDKLEKAGEEAVIKELESHGIEASNVERIMTFIGIKGSNDQILDDLEKLGIDNPLFREGLQELAEVVHYIRCFNVPEESFTVDLTIARGLDYYTGTVYETILKDYPDIGSVCSGGRYDNLAEYYTQNKLPGVGISIGLTRLFYQLKEAGILGEEQASTLSQVLIIPMDDTVEYGISVGNRFREKGIIAQLHLDKAKVGKKLAYADKMGIPYAVLLGSEERENGRVSLKNLKTGSQDTLTVDEAVQRIQSQD